MRLELYAGDLEEEYRRLPINSIKFEHLSPYAQRVVEAAGKGTFCHHPGTKREEYQVIYPPVID